VDYSRRDFGKLALAALPAAAIWREYGVAGLSAADKINSKIKGVRIGAITYSFRTMPAAEIIPAYVKIGIGEMELMSNHAEALAGMPSTGRGGGGGGGRGSTPLTPEQQAARDAAAKAAREWRTSATEATFKQVRKKIEDAGIELKMLCYNMNVARTTDQDIEYAFMMAKGLGVEAISTSTQVSMAKRLAPFSDKHKIPIGFHGHADINNPDEVSTPETFEAVMTTSKYHWANLDLGHFTEAGYDAVVFLQKHHARITNLHLKDKKKGVRGNGPWGTGDTPIKESLKLLQKNKWNIPANIEFEYEGDPVTEVAKCFQLCKEMLA
jgi:sugar phosphate isomerase/epimerase